MQRANVLLPQPDSPTTPSVLALVNLEVDPIDGCDDPTFDGESFGSAELRVRGQVGGHCGSLPLG